MTRNEAEKRLRDLLWVIEGLPEGVRVVEVDTLNWPGSSRIALGNGIEEAAAAFGQAVTKQSCKVKGLERLLFVAEGVVVYEMREARTE